MRKVIESAPRVVKDIGKWLRENLLLVRDNESARFTRVVTRHLVKGNKRGEEVFFIEVPKRPREEWAETAGLDIYTRLQAEAATLGGLQKWALYAYHSDDNEHHTSRFLIKLQGSDDDDDNELDSEGPDKVGLTSQAMRHTEGMAKVMISGQMTILSALQSTVARQSAMIEKLLEQRFNDFEMVEAALTRKAEREIELTKAQARAAALQDIGKKLGLFIPAVANKIAGTNLFPVQANAVMMMTKGLFTSIASNEDKMKQLTALLGPEELVAFMNVLEEVSKNVGENGLPTDGDNPPNGMATHSNGG